MMFVGLVVFLLAGSNVQTDNVEISSESVCFHGKIADEMMKHYISTKYGKQGQNCNGGYKPKDCGEIDKKSSSDVYTIFPDGAKSGFDVYCDMDTDEGGWTVFQRRLNGETNFTKNWTDYEKGFGNLKKEFWLGNEKLHILTTQGNYELRVDLEDFENNKRYAEFSKFSVGNASSKYKLTVEGYKGDAGDSMSTHNSQAFSTIDSDNDSHHAHCAVIYKGGWWYGYCHQANLNGPYLKGEYKSYADGINWMTWRGYHYSLKTTSMMIRKLI